MRVVATGGEIRNAVRPKLACVHAPLSPWVGTSFAAPAHGFSIFGRGGITPPQYPATDRIYPEHRQVRRAAQVAKLHWGALQRTVVSPFRVRHRGTMPLDK